MNKTKTIRRNGATRGRHRDGGNGKNGASKARRFGSPKNKLEAAIARYVDLYDFAPIAYVSFDRAGRIEEANLAATELLGISRDLLIGRPFALFVADSDSFLHHLLLCRTSDYRVETELRLKPRRGKPISVQLLSTPITSSATDGARLFQTAIIDLTERQRAEHALREKEVELERIVTKTPFMLTRCTRDLRYRFVSPAYAGMLGRQPEDIVGKPIVEIMGKDGLAKIRQYVRRVLSGETVSYEGFVPFRDNESRFLRAVYVPDRNAGGDIVGWIASLIDLTESKRAEAAALRLAAIVQSSRDAIVAKDLDGCITDWNESAQRIFGYTRKEVIGKSILILIPKERHREEEEILKKVRNGESLDHFETVRQRKNGKLIDVSLTISPIKDRNGKIIGVSKIARDITKQKQTERRVSEQARLLDLTHDAVIVRDTSDRIVYWNRGAQLLYGYEPEEAVGKIAHKLLRTKHSEPLAQIFKKLDRDGRWSGELIHKRKDATTIVVMSRWTVDRDSRGRLATILETNTDITERKRAEMALQRSRSMLEKLVQHRTKALRDANVELEAEITRRKGLEGEILAVSDREQQKLGQELHDGVCQQLTAIAFLARATSLRLKDHRVVQTEDLEKIAQLINSAVMDARHIARDLHKEEIDAAMLTDALRDLTERKIWKTRCRFQCDGELNIEDDRVASEVFRILREGIINANKHAHATEIVLTASRRKRELVFSVTDNGVGLKGLGKKQRSGLGFHIMQYRAQSIGARLEMKSPRRGGTRLAVYVPLPK